MVLFFKLWFFFFIGNLIFGSAISLLASDPLIDCPASETGCENPNTTFFASLGVGSPGVTAPDTEAFYGSQFSPENETGGSVGDASAGGIDAVPFWESIDFLNIGELLRFLSFVNPLYTFDVMEDMFASVGIDEDSLTTVFIALKAIFFALGMLGFIFVIFKIDVI